MPLAVLVGATVPHADVHGVVPCVKVQLTPWLLVSLLTVAVNGVIFNCEIAFTGMIALVGETETVMASTVMPTEPCLEVSESEVATIVTDKSFAGGVEGAVYVVGAPLAVAVGEMLPHCGTPHAGMDQVTPLFAGSSLTVATILGTVWANCTVDAGAVTITEIALTVTTIEVCAAGSATEVAVTVTDKSADGGVGGAV